MVTTAAFVAAYCGVLDSGDTPPFPEVVLTIQPSSPLATMVGTNALMPWITPQTFTASAHAQSLRSCSHMGPSAPAPMPALLHTTCTAPNASRVASRNASTEA